MLRINDNSSIYGNNFDLVRTVNTVQPVSKNSNASNKRKNNSSSKESNRNDGGFQKKLKHEINRR